MSAITPPPTLGLRKGPWKGVLVLAGAQGRPEGELRLYGRFLALARRFLGVTDAETLTTCKRFREARNHLVHEKAIEPHAGVDGTTFHTAQREVEIGVFFVRSITSLLLAPLTGRSGGPPSAAAAL